MSGDVTPEWEDLEYGYADPQMQITAYRRITELEAALAERDATIAAVASRIEFYTYEDSGAVECVVAIANLIEAAPGDALTAHNAEVWEEGFRADPTGSYDGDIGAYGGNPYRAKPIWEGK